MIDEHSAIVTSEKSSLRQMMVIFLLVIVTAVIAINGWIVWSSWNRMISTSQTDARNLSLSLSRQAEDSFLQVDLTLQDLHDRISLIGLREEQTDYLREMLTNRKASLPQLHGLFIFDAEGNWLVTSDGNMPKRANNGDREYFHYHQQHSGNQVHIGKVIRSRTTGDLIIPVSMRLDNYDGSFRGVLLATIRLDYFKQIYSYYNLGEHDVLALMLKDGTLLYVRPFPDNTINRNISNSPLFTNLLKNATDGTAIYPSALDGIERVFGYASLKRYPLVVAIGYDKQQLLEVWFSDISISIVLCTILLLVIFLLGLLVLRHISLNLRNQHELTQVRDRLTSMNRTLQTLALVDGLTGLANRRQFDLYLQRSAERSAKLHTPLALLMIDVDSFKLFNDTYGHLAGDECLKLIGDTLTQLPRRPVDLVARYGGEEFAVIMPGANHEAALRFAHQAVDAIAALAIPHEQATTTGGIVTISAGMHVINAERSANISQALIAEADKALYAAKKAGKNRVEENQSFVTRP
ncbi:sensor domain-containing diguanylate cyclase [Erwinia sp. Eh17-17]|uniref:sensor domain-containing diguanylate cyclase n=1 Tax=Erwinia sp. Eh17-17 TaxID=3080330 RepID=UPI003208B7C8